VTTKAELLEQCAEAAHNAWMAEKMRRGVTTWPNELGDEQLRPYDELAESVKEFDRIVIGGIMSVLAEHGLTTELADA
jgi:hypothetical protein